MDVRTRRLQADFERIQQMLRDADAIRVAETIGTPPERYEIEYRVSGLVKKGTAGKVTEATSFRVEITLTEGYPRMAPQCRMVTPTFHPNIITDAICVTDYWSAGSSLARLIVRIGEMLAYQSYGLKFPLNPDAANWLEANLDRIPTDTTDFVSVLHAGEGVLREDESDIRESDRCVECGQLATATDLHVTSSHHLVCDSCAHQCTHCQTLLSSRSPHETCQVCDQWACYKCIHRCLNCATLVCTNHMVRCAICELGHCEQCVVQCSDCDNVVCVEHAAPSEHDGVTRHRCESCLLQES